MLLTPGFNRILECRKTPMSHSILELSVSVEDIVVTVDEVVNEIQELIDSGVQLTFDITPEWRGPPVESGNLADLNGAKAPDADSTDPRTKNQGTKAR